MYKKLFLVSWRKEYYLLVFPNFSPLVPHKELGLFALYLVRLNASYHHALKWLNIEHKCQPTVLLFLLVLCMQVVSGQSCGVRTQTGSWSLLIACCLVPCGAVRCGLCFATKYHNASKCSVLHCTTELQHTFVHYSTELYCTALYFTIVLLNCTDILNCTVLCSKSALPHCRDKEGGAI